MRVYNVPGQMKLELRDIIHMFFEGHSIGKKMTILKPNVTWLYRRYWEVIESIPVTSEKLSKQKTLWPYRESKLLWLTLSPETG